MKPMGDERTHYLLALGMAKATRTDLVDAMETGALDNDAWARMLHRCRSCGWPEGCADWVDHQMESGAECPPSCVNQRRFAELRARSAQARRDSDIAVEAATLAMARAERVMKKAAGAR
ncbi:DUF6455 family protein [Vannielia litorea]|uniref:DUF6455 domain-containing protein n=1 Tax=Vannielia litorea TaxID=1217970 RepID=A0A1N6H0R6_9RHOB|nr:DUF6455 family protein [Vannielia litorea]SIO13336.1 hypothetical protein SAMN05444002_2968 [Vannielia litorea]